MLKLLYEWSIFSILNHGPIPLCLLPFPEMFMYSPIALALSLSPLFATTFFLLCNKVWLRWGVAKQWDALPLSHNCASQMLCRPIFSPGGFLNQCLKKNCSWNNTREHDVCFSVCLAVRWAIEMELDIARGEFFSCRQHFSLPLHFPQEKNSVCKMIGGREVRTLLNLWNIEDWF